jgi:hypothetical protein
MKKKKEYTTENGWINFPECPLSKATAVEILDSINKRRVDRQKLFSTIPEGDMKDAIAEIEKVMSLKEDHAIEFCNSVINERE